MFNSTVKDTFFEFIPYYLIHTVLQGLWPGCSEDEYHLYTCPLLQTERTNFYKDHIADIGTFMMLSDVEKTKFLLNEEIIKAMGAWVEALYKKRRSIIYKGVE